MNSNENPTDVTKENIVIEGSDKEVLDAMSDKQAAALKLAIGGRILWNLSPGRTISRLRRQADAKSKRKMNTLVSKGTGDQHRAWRAAGRVGSPSDY